MPERRGPDRPRPGGRGSGGRDHRIPRARDRPVKDEEGTVDYIQRLKVKYSEENRHVPRQRSLGHMESDEDWRVEAGIGSAMRWLPVLILGFLWTLMFSLPVLLAGMEGRLIMMAQVLLFALNVVLTMFLLMSRSGGRKRRRRRTVK